jgi:hypothetical protein
MPRGPKGEKRPSDANRRAIMVARIATGEIEDKVTDGGKSAAAVALEEAQNHWHYACHRRRLTCPIYPMKVLGAPNRLTFSNPESRI